jgi:hypothetical protein
MLSFGHSHLRQDIARKSEMTRRSQQRRRGQQRKRTGGEPNDRHFIAQFCGAVVLFIAFLLLIPAVRETYRWARRADYYRTEIEVQDTGASSYLRSMSAKVVSTGERLSVNRTDFTTVTVQGEGMKRYAVWYNPKAVAYFGIELYDQRVIPVEGNPSFGDSRRATWHWVVMVVVAGAGAFLFTRPYSRRRRA